MLRPVVHKMIRSILEQFRSRRLSTINRSKLRAALREPHLGGKVPIFYIFTPELVHFAPFCLPARLDEFEPVILLNAVSREDEEWMRTTLRKRSIVRLTTSLRGNSGSMLAHAEVLNDLFAECDQNFCIQDPDCFIVDARFWENVGLNDDHFAGGPFTKRPSSRDHILPDTFFIQFNSAVFKRIAKQYNVSASVTREVTGSALERIKVLGYESGGYPESYKDYFDTLQVFWLLSLAEGLEFLDMPGAANSIFHIGGTSYMHKTNYELSHWDYWPLSVHYFNLRLLERPELERFRGRFRGVIRQHGSSDRILTSHPEFLDSIRYSEIERILCHCEKNNELQSKSFVEK